MATTPRFAIAMGLWNRIKRAALTDVAVLVKGIDHDLLEEIERVLLEADFGAATFELLEELEESMRRGKIRTETALRGWLIDQIAGMLDGPVGGQSIGELNFGDGDGPAVMLMLGVNGVGKTTQAAKLANWIGKRGKSVLLAAADTFRAAGSEQLEVWADRLGVPAVTGVSGGDPAAVAFDAVDAATARNLDVVIVDTAGRLHTEKDLMTELNKLARVIARRREGAPHESFLVLDGTVGQNAMQQGKVFAGAVPLTGLIVTKLDGTAKGGAVVALRREIDTPVRFLGVGEGIDDLEEFEPRRFAERLLGD